MAELALCERLGVSHSHFLGGPARWTGADREKALAYSIYKASMCGGCGTERAEWDPKLGGDPEAYIGGIDVCQMCVVLAQEARNIQSMTQDNPDAADGARPILRRTSAMRRDERGDLIDDE